MGNKINHAFKPLVISNHCRKKYLQNITSLQTSTAASVYWSFCKLAVLKFKGEFLFRKESSVQSKNSLKKVAIFWNFTKNSFYDPCVFPNLIKLIDILTNGARNELFNTFLKYLRNTKYFMKNKQHMLLCLLISLVWNKMA